MKLMFITFAPLSSNAGHLARLISELNNIKKLNMVSIVCLNKNADDDNTIKKYKEIKFLHLPIEFNGWKIVSLSRVVQNIIKLINKESPNLVILQMEVWDLMRELGKKLKNKMPFAVIVHSTPFLGSPINMSTSFEHDVVKYTNSGIEDYRKKYILNHFNEAKDVFKNINIIASNKTVKYFMSNYFPNLNIYTLPLSPIPKTKIFKGNNKSFKYDFVYMARIEKGKGIEYLNKILENISKIVSRPVKIAILGRTDDLFSQTNLDQLINNSKLNKKNYTVDYLGWADEKLKKKILLNSKIFLYPSIYDTYAIVLQEALSYGLPVITWDVPFARLNYKTSSVIKVSLFDTTKFADEAARALNHRENLSIKALKFSSTLNSSTEIALADTKLFKEIFNNE